MMFTGKFINTASTQEYLQGDHHEESYREGNMTIYFWGKIYNAEKWEHERENHQAKLIGDLFLKYNTSRFHELDGSFTFIIYLPDRIIIARDHHGCGPQVYYNTSHFASSLSLLQETGSCSTTVNTKALSSFLAFGYIPTPESAFKEACKLGEGEMLIHENDTNRTEKLFITEHITPLPFSKEKSLDELASEYGELHTNAIRKRIGDSRNIGILLSGGYDSGSNLAALRKIYTGDVHSFSIGFKGDHWSELPLARCMSDAFDTIHHEYEIDGSEIKALPEIVRFLGEPFVEGGLMVNYAVMEMMKNNKPDVILGGDGSDQYFGTSGREIALHYLSQKYGMEWALKMLFSMLNHSFFEKDSPFYRVRFHLDKVLNIFQGDRFGFPDFSLNKIVQDSKEIFIPGAPAEKITSFESLYTNHLYKTDIERTINQVILFKAARMAEMFGNNLTFPYMDTSLYQFLMKLPVHYKCKGDSVKEIARGHGISKFLLKYHYKAMLPEAITCKKKQGGFAPMPLFFKDEKQRAGLTDFILNSAIMENFLQKKQVEIFLKQYDEEAKQTGKWFWYRQARAIQFFNLLTLSIWWEIHIKKNSTLTIL